PTITVQPQSRTNIAGTTANFSVAASGTGPLSYQWRKESTNLTGATTANLTLTGVQLTDAGSYTVVVTNIAGAVTSTVARLTVWVLPTITVQPQSRTNIAGTTANFSVTAAGTTPLTCQWRRNGVDVLGATGTNYTITAVTSNDAGNYVVVVSNVAGSVTSTPPAMLTVWVPPTITMQPQNRTNIAGTPASFSVTAAGTAPLSYLWRKNGSDIPGATGPSYRMASVTTSDEGSYAVVVTNVAGAVTSQVATLTVWVPPTIAVQPQSRTNIAGTTATFGVVASGTGPLSYQWRKEGANLASATATNLTLTGVQPTDAGNYMVVVTNIAGSVTSAVATLTVWVPPAITGQPHSRTNIAGTTANFSVSASGTGPLSYQWRKEGANLAGATAANLTLAGVQPSDAGNYTVVVANIAGSVTSAVATLTVWVPPTITGQPQSRTVLEGTEVSFVVAASGTMPLAYQWFFGATPLTGATNATLTLLNVQTNRAGRYWVTVSNVAGSTNSDAALLLVQYFRHYSLANTNE
ncbi:MAG: immunoglobulin domain-containing protein, partial [Verrucomicrobia bacterium]|nr:immunoglobulin domain-containing protein [Verrucomicrobiota bacterium]